MERIKKLAFLADASAKEGGGEAAENFLSK